MWPVYKSHRITYFTTQMAQLIFLSLCPSLNANSINLLQIGFDDQILIKISGFLSDFRSFFKGGKLSKFDPDFRVFETLQEDISELRRSQMTNVGSTSCRRIILFNWNKPEVFLMPQKKVVTKVAKISRYRIFDEHLVPSSLRSLYRRNTAL